MIVRLVTHDWQFIGNVTLPPLFVPELIAWSGRHFIQAGTKGGADIPIYRECMELYTTSLDPVPGNEE